ncbi:MAG: acetate--CoA ligase [Deltaproteobacteria bacterium]|nr:acetate--CoA ligase [Deltaproteobacteria bacterium]
MSESIDSVLKEKRKFKPSAAFAKNAIIGSATKLAALQKKAAKNPVKFWEEQARTLDWFKPWKKALVWKHPFAKWFAGGRLNIAYNCLDRHLKTPRKHKAALIWEGEPGEVRTLTYHQLYLEVCRVSNVLKNLGVKKGDVVAIYMGMIPEAVMAMLACARIGATHNLVFGGFSAEALRDRIHDSKAVCLITQDGAYRRGAVVNLIEAADRAVAQCPTVKNVLVYQRMSTRPTMKDGRDHLWQDLVPKAPTESPAEKLDSEHPLFILYTSGSTGKPKGILHTAGGYLTQVAYTSKIVFDLKDEDLYFCTADIGWVTGHSYVVYGPLANGTTVFLYEGAPNYPRPDRFWDMIERHKVTIFYTAPTAIRAFMRAGDEFPKKHDMSSLRLLGTVGEPINPEAWIWYHEMIGAKRCPIVDTWWQTETGSILISPVPGATVTKPGTATQALPGIIADVVRDDGTSCKANEGGSLVIKHPWPSMLRTVFGDDQRYVETYWRKFAKQGYYLAGDSARRDEDGYFWIMGRADDVVKISGHRLGTAEIESALVANHKVAEAAVVAKPDDIKGSALVAFVTLKADAAKAALGNGRVHHLKEELRAWVAKEIGPIAKPDEVRFTDALPKTRSGKIMRRLLREVVTGSVKTGVKGDTTTLEDFSVLEKLRQGDEE